MFNVMTEILKIIQDWQGLIGAIIGSALAAFIAIKSIRTTHKNQIFLENNKIQIERYQEEKVYCGHVFATWALLKGHQNFLEALHQELKAILNDFKLKKRIAYNKTFTALPIDLLKECFLKIIGYEKYDNQIVVKITSYLSVIDSLTNELDFSLLIKQSQEINIEIEYMNKVEFYFNKLFEHINILKITAKEIEEDALKIISNSNTSNLITEEANKIDETLNELKTSSYK